MMRNPQRHHRRSIRLEGYDYTRPGAYFVTICTKDRRCLFGEVINGEMRLNEAGQIARRCWLDIPNHFPHVSLDAFVVMPNHIHGILVINESVTGNVRAKNFSPQPPPTSPQNDDATVRAKNFSPLPPTESDIASARQPRGTSKTVGSVIRGFKIGVTKWMRTNDPAITVWQRNYYEHIIRDEESLNSIRQYILDNPSQWITDRENPSTTPPVAEDP